MRHKWNLFRLITAKNNGLINEEAMPEPFLQICHYQLLVSWDVVRLKSPEVFIFRSRIKYNVNNWLLKDVLQSTNQPYRHTSDAAWLQQSPVFCGCNDVTAPQKLSDMKWDFLEMLMKQGSVWKSYLAGDVLQNIQSHPLVML